MVEKIYTEEQNSIIELNYGQHLVLAGQGTGKTEILSQRLCYALKNGIKSDEMLCLTFTNRTAQNMIDRVKENIGDTEVYIGNIHTFCYMYLKDNKLISSNMVLLDEEDVEDLYFEVFSAYDDIYIWENNKKVKMGTFHFSKIRTIWQQEELNFPDGLIDSMNINLVDESEYFILEEMYKMYKNIKLESNYLEFDDLSFYIK